MKQQRGHSVFKRYLLITRLRGSGPAEPQPPTQMAQTEKGQKFIRVPQHTREQDGKTITVPAHVRSTPNTSGGSDDKEKTETKK